MALGEGKTGIAAVVERKEKDPVRFPLQKAAQTDIEALLVAPYGPTNRGMNDKGEVLSQIRFLLVYTGVFALIGCCRINGLAPPSEPKMALKIAYT